MAALLLFSLPYLTSITDIYVSRAPPRMRVQLPVRLFSTEGGEATRLACGRLGFRHVPSFGCFSIHVHKYIFYFYYRLFIRSTGDTYQHSVLRGAWHYIICMCVFYITHAC